MPTRLMNVVRPDTVTFTFKETVMELYMNLLVRMMRIRWLNKLANNLYDKAVQRIEDKRKRAGLKEAKTGIVGGLEYGQDEDL